MNMLLGQSLKLARCPHCQIANPLLPAIGPPLTPSRADGNELRVWAVFSCTSCGGVVTARCKSVFHNTRTQTVIDEIFPSPKSAHADLPAIAGRYLQQAFETLHAPDAAAIMAGSAVDAMLKELGYEAGSVYVRIEQAVKNNVLTRNMGEWAHAVRLGSNRPRHADERRPHVTPQEAQQSVEFAEALGQFIFVLRAQIDRGVEKALSSTASDSSEANTTLELGGQ